MYKGIHACYECGEIQSSEKEVSLSWQRIIFDKKKSVAELCPSIRQAVAELSIIFG